MPNYSQELWQLDRTIARVAKQLERARDARDRAGVKREMAERAQLEAQEDVDNTKTLLDELRSAREVLDEQNDPSEPPQED